VVNEGLPITVRTRVLRGVETLPPDKVANVELALRRKVRPGRLFDEDEFAQAETDLRHAVADQGYAYAKVTRTANVDLVNHTADVVFDVTPDFPATFGEVTIEGLGQLPELPVRRALAIEPGSQY